METLPTELHLCIIHELLSPSFPFAATSSPHHTDSSISYNSAGAPIRALASTSKYFNTIARPYIYHTIAALGADQATALLYNLEACTTARRGIRHLFLADVVPASRSSEATWPAATDIPASKSQTKPVPRLTPAHTHTLARLLALSAPSLHTLSVSFTSPHASTALIARLLRLSFPALHTLSICGFYPFPSAPNRFPRLKVLKLSGNKSPYGLLGMGGALGDACPCLEILEVRGVVRQSAFWGETVRAVERRRLEMTHEDTAQTEEDGDGYDASLPPGLTRVTLQAADVCAGMSLFDAALKDVPPPGCDVHGCGPQLDTARQELRGGGRSRGLEVVVLAPAPAPLGVGDLWAEWVAGV